VDCREERSAQKQMAKDFHKQYFCALGAAGKFYITFAAEFT
jgi:hypothetical protein